MKIHLVVASGEGAGEQACDGRLSQTVLGRGTTVWRSVTCPDCKKVMTEIQKRGC